MNYIVSDAQYLEERVVELLRERGARIESDHRSRGSFDLVISFASSRIFVENKVLGLYRSADFRARIGDAILRFQKQSPGRQDGLLLALLVNRPSDKALKDLDEYARRYCPELNWLLLYKNGKGHIRLNGQDENVEIMPYEGRHLSSGKSNRSDIFSPNNQLLLKILLLSGISDRFWGGPAHRPQSVMELARLAGVSQASCSNFLSRAVQNNYMIKEPGYIKPINHVELLESWSLSQRNRLQRAIGLRSLYGGNNESELLKNIASYASGFGRQPPVIVSGHQGCHLLGLGRSSVRSVRLFVDQPVDEILERLDLVRDESGSSSVWLVPGPCPSSVRAGYVVNEGVPVADVLQCYLDVRGSFARGQEQSDYIYEKVLRPHFEAR